MKFGNLKSISTARDNTNNGTGVNFHFEGGGAGFVLNMYDTPAKVVEALRTAAEAIEFMATKDG